MILYLGNNLTLHGNTPSSIETLGKFLGLHYPVKRFSNRRNQLLRGLDMMRAIVRHNQTTSVVLIDAYSSLAFYYVLGAAILCRIFRIAYVPILRGGDLKSRLDRTPSLSRFIFSGAKYLVAPSSYLYSVFRDSGFANVLFIPNSIEMDIYKMKVRTQLAPRILWVRSFHLVYNPLMALEVLEKLLVHFPEAELCMVGPDKDGSLKQCKEYVLKKGLKEKVKFTGVLTKPEWHALSEHYDFFINTATIDNTPVSVIEAMALGLVVVSTNVGGVPYLISDNKNGLLIDNADVNGMVDKIRWLMDHPTQAGQLALHARKHVEEFDWELVKFKWFKILDEMEAPFNKRIKKNPYS
jgi:glycosyltransferase involved in cell wall biosynthesis